MYEHIAVFYVSSKVIANRILNTWFVRSPGNDKSWRRHLYHESKWYLFRKVRAFSNVVFIFRYGKTLDITSLPNINPLISKDSNILTQSLPLLPHILAHSDIFQWYISMILIFYIFLLKCIKSNISQKVTQLAVW